MKKTHTENTILSFFFWVSIIYFLFATGMNFALRRDSLFVSVRVLENAGGVLDVFFAAAPLSATLILVAYLTSPETNSFIRRIAYGSAGIALACVFLTAFSSIKGTLPILSESLGFRPFFADPFLASLDRSLHGGRDPWELTHEFIAWLGTPSWVGLFPYIYGLWWAIPAFYLPSVMFLLGDGGNRIWRFLLLYLFTWCLLGNVLAFLGLSAGPVYFDRVTGDAMFEDLEAALRNTEVVHAWFGKSQDWLWQSYSEDLQSVGSGISAFPSLHVAAATVTTLYMIEKSPWLAPPGLGLLIAMQFISVWSGYHYAIDGYFSIAAVVVMYFLLRGAWLRKLVARGENDAPSRLTARTSAE